MKIDSSVVSLYSTSKSTKKYSLKESLHTWIGEKHSAQPQKTQNFNKFDHNKINNHRVNNSNDNPFISKLDEFLILLIEMLTGIKISIADLRNIIKSPNNLNQHHHSQKVSHKTQGDNSKQFNYVYKLEETYTETQRVTLSAQGIVNTSDGKAIEFNLDLFLDRRFVESKGIQISNGKLTDIGSTTSRLQTARPVVDPLVINFNASAASLSGNTFSFDLDSDGINEDISMLNGGSGFLAFDKNNDGIINNGSELFGPQSGNGFNELAQYDDDGNMWIDENDEIYDKLSVWTVNSTGENQLKSLKETDVGAIFLGNVTSNFTYKDAENNSIANSKGLGIYLHENGIAGSIQQLDYYI